MKELYQPDDYAQESHEDGHFTWWYGAILGKFILVVGPSFAALSFDGQLWVHGVHLLASVATFFEYYDGEPRKLPINSP